MPCHSRRDFNRSRAPGGNRDFCDVWRSGALSKLSYKSPKGRGASANDHGQGAANSRRCKSTFVSAAKLELSTMH